MLNEEKNLLQNYLINEALQVNLSREYEAKTML